MTTKDNRPEWTRWRSMDDPVSPLDILGENSPRYEAGHLPSRFVLLLWDGHAVRGPMRFHSQIEADNYLELHRGEVSQYLVIPSPLES